MCWFFFSLSEEIVFNSNPCEHQLFTEESVPKLKEICRKNDNNGNGDPYLFTYLKNTLSNSYSQWYGITFLANHKYIGCNQKMRQELKWDSNESPFFQRTHKHAEDLILPAAINTNNELLCKSSATYFGEKNPTRLMSEEDKKKQPHCFPVIYTG